MQRIARHPYTGGFNKKVPTGSYTIISLLRYESLRTLQCQKRDSKLKYNNPSRVFIFKRKQFLKDTKHNQHHHNQSKNKAWNFYVQEYRFLPAN